MGKVNFDQISVTSLNVISVEGGDVLHAIKKNDFGFNGFGEAYFSWVKYGSIKAWKKHNKMVMNLIVPYGVVKFVFYSESSNNFKVIEIGENNYSRITVPPGVWFGFQGIKSPGSLVLNIADIQHDPNEVSRKELAKIDFFWDDL